MKPNPARPALASCTGGLGGNRGLQSKPERNMNPTKLDIAVHAYICAHGPCAVTTLQEAGLSTSREMLYKIVKRLTAGGYLRYLPQPKAPRVGMWMVVADKLLPEWVSQTGPKGGPRMPVSDPAWERRVTRSTGTVPLELLLRLTLIGMVAQQLTWRVGT